MIFTVDDEGEPNEQVNFKMIDIDEEWILSNHKAEYLSEMPDRHSTHKAAVSPLVHKAPPHNNAIDWLMLLLNCLLEQKLPYFQDKMSS